MIYRFESGSPEWLTFRQKYIMATEVAPMFGVNPYTSMAKILREKLETPTPIISHHLRDGKIYEPAVMQAIREDLKWDVGYLQLDGCDSFVFNQPRSCIAATPDVWRWDEPAIIELKTTTEENLDKNWLKGIPPIWYLTQVQAQLHAVGGDLAYLVGMDIKKDPKLVVYKVRRSDAFIDRMETLGQEAIELLSTKSDKFRAASRDRVFAETELGKTWEFMSVSSYMYQELQLPKPKVNDQSLPEDDFSWGAHGL